MGAPEKTLGARLGMARLASTSSDSGKRTIVALTTHFSAVSSSRKRLAYAKITSSAADGLKPCFTDRYRENGELGSAEFAITWATARWFGPSCEGQCRTVHGRLASARSEAPKTLPCCRDHAPADGGAIAWLALAVVTQGNWLETRYDKKTRRPNLVARAATHGADESVARCREPSYQWSETASTKEGRHNPTSGTFAVAQCPLLVDDPSRPSHAPPSRDVLPAPLRHRRQPARAAIRRPRLLSGPSSSTPRPGWRPSGSSSWRQTQWCTSVPRQGRSMSNSGCTRRRSWGRSSRR